MSVLTKTFVILHVVMSMLFVAGVVVFVNRVEDFAAAKRADTAQLNRLQEEARVAQAAETAVRAQQAAVQQQAMAQAQQATKDLGERDRQILELRGQIAELQAQSASTGAALVSANEALKVAQNNLGLVNTQLAELRTAEDKLRQEYTDANLQINDLTNRLQQTERARRNLEEQLAVANEQGGGRAGADPRDAGQAGANIPRNLNLNGVIRETRMIQGIPYATISIGRNDAVERGMTLSILDRNSGQWLGYVDITNVEDEEAIGRLRGNRVSDVKVNDQVRTQIAG